MGLFETLGLRQSTEAADLREELTRQRWQSQMFAESLQRLELHMEEEGWRRLGEQLKHEFSRGGLDLMMDKSRALYLSDPLIQRAVNVQTYYTWGQGVSFNAAEERVAKEVLEPLTSDERNRGELFSHQARILTDIDQIVDGNVFVALFTNERADVSLRCFPADEIREVHCKPGDRAIVYFYRRVWSETEFDPETGKTEQKQYEVLYPDIQYRPTRQPDSIGGVEVRWDAPIAHQKTGGFKRMRFGVPETYAALDWAQAYHKFLEDWHTIVSSLARFAWKVSTKGSKIQRAKDKLNSTITKDNAQETNRPPVPGAAFVAGEGDDITPIPKTGAHTSADDARPSRLMVAAAMDLPDTILSGDADVGNLATARSLDRPTELAMRNRQSMWSDFLSLIFRYVVDAKVLRARLPGKRILTPDGIEVETSIDPMVEVSFPPILEHDVKETVSALVTAATLDGKVEAGTLPRELLSKMLMEAVGVEDVETAIGDLDADARADLANAVEGLQRVLERARLGD